MIIRRTVDIRGFLLGNELFNLMFFIFSSEFDVLLLYSCAFLITSTTAEKYKSRMGEANKYISVRERMAIGQTSKGTIGQQRCR